MRHGDCPYPGWTLPQLRFWMRASSHLRGTILADVITGVQSAIAASFDKEANRKIAREVARLTEGPR